MLTVYEFTSSGRAVFCDEPIGYDQKTEASITRIWKEMVADSSILLFDGDLLCVKSCDDNKLVCQLTSYRYFAVSRRPGGGEEIPVIRGLGVSALLTSRDGRIMFGRRSKQMFQNPGTIELAGCGGVPGDRVGETGEIDYAGQLLAEIEEETGILHSEITKMKPVCMVADDRRKSVDIVMKLECCLDADEILNRHKDLPVGEGGREYDELFAIKPEALADFLWSGIGRFVGVSLKVLEKAGYTQLSGNQ